MKNYFILMNRKNDLEIHSIKEENPPLDTKYVASLWYGLMENVKIWFDMS